MAFNIVEVDNGRIRLIDVYGSSIGVLNNPVRTNPTGSTIQPISVDSLPLPSGAATQSTLVSIRDYSFDIKSEIGTTNSELDILNGKDFATQSTLSIVRDKVINLSEEDFATQSTLSTVRDKVTSLSEEDFATQSTLSIVRDKVTSLSEEDFATQSTLATIRNQTNKFYFYGSTVKTSDILNTGGVDSTISVTTTPKELKIGGVVKSNRKMVMFVPESNGVKYGFSSNIQSFTVYKDQYVFLPIGENTKLWLVSDSISGKNVAIGEL